MLIFFRGGCLRGRKRNKMREQIYLCDDDTLFIDILKNSIQEWMALTGHEYEIKLFGQSEHMLQNLSEERGLYILDIEMPALSGMELAAQIRDRDNRAVIIFVSNHEEMVFEAIHYAPFRFIRKECLEEELPEALNAWETGKCKEKREDVISLHTKEEWVTIAVCNIVYLESNRHNLLFYCDGECYQIRAKISQYAELLHRSGFIQVNVSFLVNCSYISGIKGGKIILKNGEQIPIARGRIHDVKQRYMEFVREKAYGNSW